MMSDKVLTNKIIILRRQLVFGPIGAVPVLCLFFNIAGGGQATEDGSNIITPGYDMSVPKSESDNIVSSKQEAYNQNDSYMSGFNTDIVPEIDLEESNTSTWTEEKKDDFNAESNLLSLYENHNRSLDNRRSEVSKERVSERVSHTAINSSAKPSNQIEVTKFEQEEYVVEHINEPIQKEKRNVFHDNRSITKNNNSNQNNHTNISAVIHGNQEIGGARNRVKLRTKSNAIINGINIPANTIVYANAAISSDSRLSLIINNISINNKTLPLLLKVYDATDGNLGLNLSTGVNQEEKDRMGGDVIRQTGNVIASGGIIGAVVNSASTTIGNIFARNNQNSSIQLISNHQVILK